MEGGKKDGSGKEGRREKRRMEIDKKDGREKEG